MKSWQMIWSGERDLDFKLKSRVTDDVRELDEALREALDGQHCIGGNLISSIHFILVNE